MNRRKMRRGKRLSTPNLARLAHSMPVSRAFPSAKRLLGLMGLLALTGRLIALVGLPLLLALAQFTDAGGYTGGGFSAGSFRGATTEEPVYEAVDTDLDPPSVARLDRNSPLLWYKASDSSSSLVAEVGTTLAEGAAGASYADGCPLMGTDTAVTGDGTGYWQDSGTTYGNLGTNDHRVKLVFKATGTTSVLFAKRNAAVGYECGVNASDQLYWTVQDSSGATTTVSAALTAGAWHTVDIVSDRSGNCQIYLQGVASGAAVDISGRALTLDSATAFTVFADSGAASVFDSALTMLAMWTSTATAATVAQEFRALTGFRPQSSAAGRDTAPITFQRNSNATLEKQSLTAAEYFTVGPHWQRVDRWKVGSALVTGYRSELAGTGKWHNNLTIEDDWTPSLVTLSAGTDLAGLSSATVTEDNTDAVHSIVNNSIAFSNATAYVVGFVAKNSGRDVIAWGVNNAGTKIWCNFNLDTGAVGNSSGVTGYMLHLGGGVYLCWCTWVHGAAEGRSPRIYARDADTDAAPADVTYVGNSADAFDVTAPQITTGSHPSSLIVTAGGDAARAKDEVEMDITGAGVGAQGAIVLDVVQRSSDVPTAATFIDVSDAGATNRARIDQTTADVGQSLVGTTGSVTGTTSLSDGTAWRIGCTWKANRLENWVSGSREGTVDTTVTAPAAMTQCAIGQNYSSTAQPSVPTLIRRIRIYRSFQSNMLQLTGGLV